MIEITMQNGKTIRIELDAAAAPLTVENFTKLVKEGFYDGLTFHRVIPGFMIQGGCPEGTGMGGPGYAIKGEFAANGVDNPIRHTRGVISMARSQMPDSAGSQFFIMHADAPHLDGQYAAFGHVVEGIEVVDEIAAVTTDFRDKPRTPVVMKTVRVVEEAEEAEEAGGKAAEPPAFWAHRANAGGEKQRHPGRRPEDPRALRGPVR